MSSFPKPASVLVEFVKNLVNSLIFNDFAIFFKFLRLSKYSVDAHERTKSGEYHNETREYTCKLYVPSSGTYAREREVKRCFGLTSLKTKEQGRNRVFLLKLRARSGRNFWCLVRPVERSV